LLQILEATATDLKDPSTTNSRINDLAAGTVCVKDSRYRFHVIREKP